MNSTDRAVARELKREERRKYKEENKGALRLTTLAGMASFMDGGVIVGVALVIFFWRDQFDLSTWQIGAISGLLTICMGIGAMFGGRLGDRFGRKKVYQVDLLIFSAGLLLLIFAVHPWMLFAGVVVIGLSAGADIPPSLALVGEVAPHQKRGRYLFWANAMWGLGPLYLSIVAALAEPLGELMPRIVFTALLVVALITWTLRRRMKESEAWTNANSLDESGMSVRPGDLKALLRKPALGALLFTTAFYTFIGFHASFLGQYGQYFNLEVVGVTIQESVAFGVLTTPIALPIGIAVLILYFAVIDTKRRPLFVAIGATIQAVAFVPLLFLEPTLWSVFLCVTIMGIGGTFAGEAIYKVWSQEMFPTKLRGSAQGFSWGIARFITGGFIVVVPALLDQDFRILIVMFIVFLSVAAVLVYLFQPRTVGRTIAEIDQDASVDVPTDDDLAAALVQSAVETAERRFGGDPASSPLPFEDRVR
jgi:inositol transporter-like SP family MFS transporter